MSWNGKNNIKWTTKYRGNKKQKTLEFHYTEVWAPDWNEVNDTRMPPEVFIRLYHESVDGIKEGLVIALPKSLYKNNKSLVDDILENLIVTIPNSKISGIQRDWWGRTARRNSIEDLNPQEIKKMIDL